MTTSQNSRQARRDIHRPSLLDPSEYTFYCCFYQGDSDEMHDAYRDDHAEYFLLIEDMKAKIEGEQVFQGNFADRFTCDHCGAHFNHGVLFKHLPTGDLIHVGHICASDTIGLPTRAAAVRRAAEKAAAAARERAAALARATEWGQANPEVFAFLNQIEQNETEYRNAMEQANVEYEQAYNAWYLNAESTRGSAPKFVGPVAPVTSHPFLHDMVHTLNRYGNLSPRQRDAVLKFKAGAERSQARRDERQAERDAEVAPENPVAEGRREITGAVVHTKWSEDRGYGSVPKMIVKEADGNKVWSTIPECLLIDGTTQALVGKTVTFTATVEKSDRDEHFGFAKRPSKASVAA